MKKLRVNFIDQNVPINPANDRGYPHVGVKKLRVNFVDQNVPPPLPNDRGYPHIGITPFIGAPSLIEWIKPAHQKWDGITIFTDLCIAPPYPDMVDSKFKVALIIEPPAVNPTPYEQIKHYEDHYDYIFTYDESLLARGAKYIFYTLGSTDVLDEDAGIHPKSKLLSMIASKKTFCPGHRLRHKIISIIKNTVDIDLWGGAYQKFDMEHKPSRDEPLKDYMFSIVVRNQRMKNYFGEQITDCFRMGTVPIFWGCPNIGEFFNLDGIIQFDTIAELENILKNISEICKLRFLPYHHKTPFFGFTPFFNDDL